MRGARRFFSREKQVFLVGFSLTFPRFPRISKNRLNTSLALEQTRGVIGALKTSTMELFVKTASNVNSKTLIILVKWSILDVQFVPRQMDTTQF